MQNDEHYSLYPAHLDALRASAANAILFLMLDLGVFIALGTTLQP